MSAIKVEHSRFSYYADYVFYLLIQLLLILVLVFDKPQVASWWSALADIALGFAVWSLVEYLMHRFLFHGMRPFDALHDAHHQQPRALIATPTYLSAGLIGLFIGLPTFLLVGEWLGSGILLGFVLGYFAYGVVHHGVHHWRFKNPVLRRLKQVHALHHAYPQYNYGVTQTFWDRLFHSHRPR